MGEEGLWAGVRVAVRRQRRSRGASARRSPSSREANEGAIRFLNPKILCTRFLFRIEII